MSKALTIPRIFSNIFCGLTVCITFMIVASGCKKTYNLPQGASNLNVLVVEGLLNGGSGPTVIKLSRTVNILDSGKIRPELNAFVTVESESGNIYTFTPGINGEYTFPQLPLNETVRYRLRIKTAAGKDYLSDFVPVKNAPVIDSVSWQRVSGAEPGIQLYVNTHDASNKTQYYRWEFDETWEYHSFYISKWEYKNDNMVMRLNQDTIFYCWAREPPTRIVTGSSAKLTQDVISLAPLTVIPQNSIKLSVRYSILVKQYALTKQAFEYWDLMKKNTEQIGTLFDPQPSRLFSNIHSLNDPTELVLGYISAGSVAEKRIFITTAQAFPWSYNQNCAPEEFVPNRASDLKFKFGQRLLIPTVEVTDRGAIIGYKGAEPNCVECMLRGGTNVRPSFW